MAYKELFSCSVLLELLGGRVSSSDDPPTTALVPPPLGVRGVSSAPINGRLRSRTSNGGPPRPLPAGRRKLAMSEEHHVHHPILVRTRHPPQWRHSHPRQRAPGGASEEAQLSQRRRATSICLRGGPVTAIIF